MFAEDDRADERTRPEETVTRPPHVVMLVDNVIKGDSRVQKEAMSMAALGWRVTLVGRRLREKDLRRRRFGGVPARMAWVEERAGSRPQVERTTLLRNPLAYATVRKEKFADAMSQHAIADERMRIDVQKLAGRDTGARRYWSRLRMARARARRQVVARRVRASEATREKRRYARGRIDHLAISWWKLVKGTDAWQRLDPGLWDWEAAYGPIVDRLKPDLIHANDHRMLHVGARAKIRAAAKGRDVKLVWDAHEWIEGLSPWSSEDSWLPGQVSVERAFAPYADGVSTVSEVLADMLREGFDLPERPSVVCNAPLMDSVEQPEQTLREVVGLAPDVPLMVYSGGVTAARSVDTAVRALPELPGVHLAIVVKNPTHPLVLDLFTLAQELGVAERLHTAPYVPVTQIVPYLASADFGVHTILHGPNNEIALATKFYEYAQARLPIVVSDVKVMAETTRRTGQGEVFTAGDPHDLARAARLVLENIDVYRKAFTDQELMRSWTWEAQAEVLDSLYRRVLGPERAPRNP